MSNENPTEAVHDEAPSVIVKAAPTIGVLNIKIQQPSNPSGEVRKVPTKLTCPMCGAKMTVSFDAESQGSITCPSCGGPVEFKTERA